MTKYVSLWILIFCLIGCASEETTRQIIDSTATEFSAPLPSKLRQFEIGLDVEHHTDTVYASINTKDPEQRGKYQLQFTTTVSTNHQKIKIIEFGAYLLVNNEWTFKSIYNRPFNSEEFEKWYKCPDAILESGKSYRDTDNWLGKTNNLNGTTMNSLWYFLGETEKGKKLIGISEVIGIWKLK